MMLTNFKAWVKRDLGRFGDTRHRIETAGTSGACDDSGGHEEVRIQIYTDRNVYTIRAVERWHISYGAASAKSEHPQPPANKVYEKGYLGCVVQSRKPRAGENWRRGNDLPDGALDQATWLRILAGIVSYEMVQVHCNAVGDAWADIKAAWPIGEVFPEHSADITASEIRRREQHLGEQGWKPVRAGSLRAHAQEATLDEIAPSGLGEATEPSDFPEGYGPAGEVGK